MKEVFLSLPDAVIITDRFFNILEYNRQADFDGLRPGAMLSEVFPDIKGECEDTVTVKDRIYQRRVTPIYEGKMLVGYTVHLADTTDKVQLLQSNRQKSEELTRLVKEQKKANEELERYARQAESMADYSRQLRIAQDIHDNAGHAITAIHSIAQMCLQLKDTDRGEYDKLLNEGIALCDRALRPRESRRFSSVREVLENFKNYSPFPVEINISGEEPEFSKNLYDIIYAVCKEAHHNTLSHSMADRQSVSAVFGKDLLTLSIFDNGSFHGEFVKGFGLTTLEERVKRTGGTLCFHAVEGEGFGLVAKWREKE